MGGIGSALGLSGNGSGTNTAANLGTGNTNLAMPATVDQANANYTLAQRGLAQQQAFTDALSAQNGVGNQSSVYNQLSGVVNGTGPNPAAAQLAQQTAANTANQAALMAGQRGAGANTGLLARQAAMQGAANQQASVGQGATMQAQQSLNALNTQGGLATQQVAQQQGANTAYNQAVQGEQSNILNSIQGQNQALVGITSNTNNVGAQEQMQKVAGQQALVGSLTGAAGAAVGMATGGMVPAYANGTGNVQPMIASPAMPMIQSNPNGPQSNVGKYQSVRQAGDIQDTGGPGSPRAANFKGGPNTVNKQIGSLIGGLAGTSGGNAPKPTNTMASAPADASVDTGPAVSEATPDIEYAAKGGVAGRPVPAMVSPGEMYLSPAKAQAVAQNKESPMSGEKIPGKAKVKGDSLKNDIVPKTLESGGVVIPRSIMESKDAAKKAAAFVQAHLNKRGSMPKRA